MKRKILIIDDSRPILTLLHVILNKYYTVNVAANAFDAMRYLGEGNLPDLIISDVQMPDVDGFEFIQNLNSSVLYDKIPIIILSGADPKSIQEKCINLSVNDYIPKPFDPLFLLEKIKRVMGNKNSGVSYVSHPESK